MPQPASPASDLGEFEALMRRHNRALFRTARSIVLDDAEAEDVLQDAYLQAYRHLSAFRADANLRTWLTRIVLNEAFARTRKAARRAEILPMSSADTDEIPIMDETPHAQPERAAMRAETRRLIESRIDSLPEQFRVVFMLRALEDMTVEETAAVLGIPEATVRTRYFRARGLLREALSREIDLALEEAFAFDGARCDRMVAAVLARLRAG